MVELDIEWDTRLGHTPDPAELGPDALWQVSQSCGAIMEELAG